MNKNTEIAQIRREYTLESLDLEHLKEHPIQQFEYWLEEAIQAKLPEPTAFNLSTVAENGQPSSRILLLKGVENQQFVFYSNYLSKKGKEIESNPRVCLNFFWIELERQVRIEGIIEKLDSKTSTEYYQTRPRGSQIGAWTSPQSNVIANREFLENEFQHYSQRFEDQEKIEKPDFWGGYAVTPHYFEFWQGRPSRLHDRMYYQLNAEHQNWEIGRLAP